MSLKGVLNDILSISSIMHTVTVIFMYHVRDEQNLNL